MAPPCNRTTVSLRPPPSFSEVSGATTLFRIDRERRVGAR
jgi:hypothetical protein